MLKQHAANSQKKKSHQGTTKTFSRGRSDWLEPVRWRSQVLEAVDCTSLPGRIRYIRLGTVDQVCWAIQTMRVRGAPLIGVMGAYGLVLASRKIREDDMDKARKLLRKYADQLIQTRPTGVNLRWAVDRVYKASIRAGSIHYLERELRREADMIMNEELEAAHRIGEYGRDLIQDGETVLTHCNAGALATAGYGTALAVVRSAIEQGKLVKVVATETRPLLQGSRLTAFELSRDHIPVTLICDSAVAQLMSRGIIDKVVVGADRILHTGHVANKIGTLQVALAAKFYSVPFFVAAPTSTIDLVTDPSKIIIEERNQDEVLYMGGHRIAPRGVDALNPAFDLTPPELISGIITNQGLVRPPYDSGLEMILR